MNLNAFKMFTLTHLGVVTFLVLLVIASKYLTKVIQKKKLDKPYRYALVVTMVGLEIAFLIWSFVTKNGFNKDHLPFELCSVVMWVSAYALITDNAKVVKVITPWAIIGASLAFIFPSMGGDYQFPHFRLFHFFGLHILFVIAVLYYFFSGKIKDYAFKDSLRSAIYLLVYAFFIAIFNFLTPYNYLFLKHFPDSAESLHQIIKAPYHMIPLVLVIFGLICLLYLPLKKLSEVQNEDIL